ARFQTMLELLSALNRSSEGQPSTRPAIRTAFNDDLGTSKWQATDVIPRRRATRWLPRLLLLCAAALAGGSLVWLRDVHRAQQPLTMWALTRPSGGTVSVDGRAWTCTTPCVLPLPA